MKKKKLNNKKSKEKKEKKKSNITRFKTNLETGLTQNQVDQRKFQNLINKVHSGTQKSVFRIFFSNIFTLFNLIAFSVAAWLISVDAYRDLFFIIIVVSNLTIGIIQELRAKKKLDKLSFLSSPRTKVLRDGKEDDINIEDIVLDDILLLKNGDQIPADGTVKEGEVEINEAMLTGESKPKLKKKENKVLSGSYVVAGDCKIKVEKVGKDSYIEKLSSQARIYQKPKSNLLKSLKTVIRLILVIIVPITFFMYMIQYDAASGLGSSHEQYKEAVVRTSSSIISLIPAGLFLTTSIALSVGVIKLSKQQTLVQELYCIEMLARVDTMCLDKTGTITDGTMSVKGFEDFNNLEKYKTQNIVATMQKTLKDDNQTSKALLKEFKKPLKLKAKKIQPFSSSRKFSAVSYEDVGTFYLGAPEFILSTIPKKIKDQINFNAKKGYRVLLLAHSKKEYEKTQKVGKSGIKALSLIYIQDTIRSDAIDTISYFKNSGVDIKVISGDNAITAAMVAKRAEVSGADKYISLEKVSDKKIPLIVEKYNIFGRVSPNQKKLIIQELKKRKRTVAMTGDGVNDILALKEADCSIAMASGSGAARNVSHIVLLNSKFSSMPKVVQEGRRVINNVQRLATLFLTKSIFSFMLAVMIIYGFYNFGIKLTYPLELRQLNVIEFLAIGIPSFFLAFEANNNRIKGRFMLNVLKNAFPGALVIIFNLSIIYFLQNDLNIGSDSLSTISLMVIGFTFLMVLRKVCEPFNLQRKILFSSMMTMFLLALFLPPIRDFLSLVSLSTPQILLVLLLVVLTNTLLEFLIRLPYLIVVFLSRKLKIKKVDPNRTYFDFEIGDKKK